MIQVVGLVLLSGLAANGASTAAPPAGQATVGTAPQSDATSAEPSTKICKSVVAADPAAKPYQLCLSKSAWAARDKIAAQDATRMVCHYVEYTGGKFKAYKVCMPDAEWENQRQRDRQWIDHTQSQAGVPH
jgi:hypothetical protein